MTKSTSSYLNKLRKVKSPFVSLAVIVLVIGVTFSIVLARKSLDTRSRASTGTNTNIIFTDSNDVPVTQISSSSVNVRLTSPWPKTSATAMADQELRAVLGSANAVLAVGASSDDVNENGTAFDSTGNQIWIGTSTSTTNSWAGLRFNNVSIPKGATITSAKVILYSSSQQWINMKMSLYAENVANSQTFSNTSKPSNRTRTTTSVNQSFNTKWAGNTWYTLNEMAPVIQQVINRADWQQGNSLSVLIKGTGKAYARKFASSFDGNSTNSPKLAITFTTSDVTNPTPTTVILPTATPTLFPTAAPTNTTAPSPTPTLVPYTTQVELAEDQNFTVNKKVLAYTSNPLKAAYTFSNNNPGQKTLYARFTASNGQTQVFSNWIDLVAATPTPTGMSMGGTNGESMAMHAWRVGGKNAPNPQYDKCDDGTDIVAVHDMYYVVAYDGLKYPTWHPAVVTNPITGVGKCYFGHEHGSDPQKYVHWDEIYQHFGKDINGDGVITPLVINAQTGQITPGDRAGVPFGIANEHMDMYYNQENRDSVFVRHEDHVGHKIEFVNKETDVNTDLDGNITKSTHQMTQLAGTQGLNVPYYTTGSNTYQPTGVVCTHFHKFHQGTHSGDAVLNNMHEIIFHSECNSVDVNGINAPAYYPNNTVLLTGMMSFGKPGIYKRFCFAARSQDVCGLTGENMTSGSSCTLTDPLLSKLPNAINSNSLGRNMTDKQCLDNWTTLNPGNNYFAPYELWEGDFAVYRTNSLSDSTRIAEHGRQWDVLDPVRFIDVGYQHPTRSWQKDYQFNSENCKKPGGAFDQLTFVGGCNDRNTNIPYDSPQSGFKGIKRTTYFGRNHISNSNGASIYWTDPLGGNAVTTQFASGLKQKISPVTADIQKVQSRVQQLFGSNNFLNDRAIQRTFNGNSGGTIHAPN